MKENINAIDTLKFDSFNTTVDGVKQREIMSSSQISLKLDKQMLEGEIVSTRLIIRNDSFDLSRSLRYFDNEPVLYDMAISSDYYKITAGSDTYLAFIANENLCNGTLCRICDLLLFKEDSNTQELSHLLPIDFFYTELHTIVPLVGVWNRKLYYYKISQFKDTDVFLIEPFQVVFCPQKGIVLSNPEEYSFTAQLHDHMRLEIIESNWPVLTLKGQKE
jgi:hypothetical protein